MHIYIDSASLSTHLSTVMSTFWLLPLFMEPFYNMLGLQVATSPLLWNLLTSRWIFGNLAVNYRHSTCMCFIRIIMVGTIAIVSICGSVCCVGWLPWPSLHVNVGPMTLYAFQWNSITCQLVWALMQRLPAQLQNDKDICTKCAVALSLIHYFSSPYTWNLQWRS